MPLAVMVSGVFSGFADGMAGASGRGAGSPGGIGFPAVFGIINGEIFEFTFGPVALAGVKAIVHISAWNTIGWRIGCIAGLIAIEFVVERRERCCIYPIFYLVGNVSVLALGGEEAVGIMG